MNRRERRAARAIERQRDGASSAADIVSLQAAAAAAAEASPAGKYNNAGHVLASQGRAEEARTQFQRAIAVDPDFALAHFNLGVLHHGQGRLDQAVDCYLRVIELKPDHMEAHNNLCAVLLARGQFAAVAEHCEAILEIRPNQSTIYGKLAIAHVRRGDTARALDVLTRSLQVAESQENKFLFVMCLETLQTTPATPEMRDLIVRAISEPWARPAQLAGHCLNLIKADPVIASCVERAAAAWPQRLPAARLYGGSGLAAMAREPALRALLENARNTDIAMERFLTGARLALLDLAEHGEDPGDDVLAFYCALARQCFINEYVFACDADEQARVEALRESLTAALQFDGRTPAIWPVAVAAYQPLHHIAGSAALLAKTWPTPLEDLLIQQLRNPIEELRLRAAIPQLTPIDDDVSLLVQQQYEEHPYPQWVKAAPAQNPTSVDTRLRSQFPFANFRNLGKPSPDVLVAGCGTGQQLVDVVRDTAGARVLAIDLSLASLGYASRQIEALGIRNIEFGQADILKLGTLGRSFDVIDCGGVLHHLGDPLAGWRVLLSLLRPDGVMRVALYSELARQHVLAAHAFVAERGYTADANGIRAFRQDVLALPDEHRVKKLTRSLDFFSMGDCRDLVFHVQEHRFTIPQIAAFLSQHDLEFLGFEVPPRIQALYDARFSADPARADLRNWDAFERELPATFGAMYQFWVQKRRNG